MDHHTQTDRSTTTRSPTHRPAREEGLSLAVLMVKPLFTRPLPRWSYLRLDQKIFCLVSRPSSFPFALVPEAPTKLKCVAANILLGSVDQLTCECSQMCWKWATQREIWLE